MNVGLHSTAHSGQHDSMTEVGRRVTRVLACERQRMMKGSHAFHVARIACYLAGSCPHGKWQSMAKQASVNSV